MPTLRDLMQEFLEDWRSDVPRSWRGFLAGVEPAYAAIDPGLPADAGELVFPGRRDRPPAGAPAGAHVFHAFDGLVLGDVRAVVVGQDPYPRVSRATGRAFEQGDLVSWTARSPRVASSLTNILKAIAHFRTGRRAYLDESTGWSRVRSDLDAGRLDLEPPAALFDLWQREGVLWLNTALTLTRYRRGGHPHQTDGHIPLWKPVVGTICRRLAARDQPTVFLAWGAHARRFLREAGIVRSLTADQVVDEYADRARVDPRSHPSVGSFLSGANPFQTANDHLESIGGTPVAW